MTMKVYRNKRGDLHRLDGPAIDGHTKEWYINGKLHREDGPAIIYNDGIKRWFLNGDEYTKIEWLIKLGK